MSTQKPSKIFTEFIDYNESLLKPTNLKEIKKQTFSRPSSGRPITDSSKIHGDKKSNSKYLRTVFYIGKLILKNGKEILMIDATLQKLSITINKSKKFQPFIHECLLNMKVKKSFEFKFL
jgi:hypothetical protein